MADTRPAIANAEPGPRILIVSNTSWSIFNFRSGLIDALRKAGYSVYAGAPPDDYSERLEKLGSGYVPLPMNNKGTNPIEDLLTIVRIWLALRRLRPLCVLTYTPKPNIYTPVAARLLGIPVVSNVAGLGSAFVGRRRLAKLVEHLYRFALRTPRRVFFQNRDDLEQFVSKGLVDGARASFLPGSGVDTAKFAPPPAAPHSEGFKFLLFGRLLGEKGVREFVGAARTLKARYAHAHFKLLGFLDAQNPSAISRGEVEQWVRQGIVEFHEPTDDVAPHIAAADCVVLPSYYREGTPRSLLEAASMGKPLITTETPGCRDAVEDGLTGFLVRPRDAAELAKKMERMLLLGPDERARMGERGRQKMLREFDERIVIGQYLDAVRECVELRGVRGGDAQSPG